MGATGLQGRAVTARLLADGWRVRAVTRDPDGAPARALAASGAEIVRAEMGDIDSLVAALRGAYGVFSVQPTVGSVGAAPDFTPADEVRWGGNVAEAARTAGVPFFLYASVAAAGRHETEVLPHAVASKWHIERHVAGLDLPAAVLRPAAFMENYSAGYYLRDGAVVAPFAADVPQQIIAVDDVAALAALAFARPREWIGRTIDVAGDELTPVQITAAISEATGRPLSYAQIPIEAVRQVSADLAYAVAWQNEHGWRADIPTTRQIHPDLMDFRTWLARTGGAQISGFLASARAGRQDP
ncbi:NmrA family NAD(P)-binding protein [Frankia sp. CN6]|uniref:NmrA family NAD(P)-binding protein n=2 Tax=Frankia nepalensis TaxID=1836974 RepID=A0A937RAV8_9ACTN|nr:NmrA family NAD(P)-binding protein [Frankia nepalensis]